MGYRLEVSTIKYCCCGGKLYGYISDDDMKKCKSWKWLVKNGYAEMSEDFGIPFYEYDAPNYTVLTKREFEEFIKLYIDDKKKYGTYHQIGENIDEYKEALQSNYVLIEWG